MFTYLTEPERLRSLISKLSPATTDVFMGALPTHQFPDVVINKFDERLAEEFTLVLIEAEQGVAPLRYPLTFVKV